MSIQALQLTRRHRGLAYSFDSAYTAFNPARLRAGN